MSVSVMLSPTEFLKLVNEILGKKKHVQELIVYYQTHPEKVKPWFNELDYAINEFNHQGKFDSIFVNANYLKTVFDKKLPTVKQLIDQPEFFKPTLVAMNQFKFFDDDWVLDKLARASLIAFYRTFLLISQPYLKDRKAQVASAIEEMLALMALKGEKTELFSAIKFWIENWQEEGFSKALASQIKKTGPTDLQGRIL